VVSGKNTFIQASWIKINKIFEDQFRGRSTKNTESFQFKFSKFGYINIP
jgi:hypothetical protein